MYTDSENYQYAFKSPVKKSITAQKTPQSKNKFKDNNRKPFSQVNSNYESVTIRRTESSAAK